MSTQPLFICCDSFRFLKLAWKIEDFWLNAPLLVLSDAQELLNGDTGMLGHSMGAGF